jgi:arylsulfatase A-like enzyme
MPDGYPGSRDACIKILENKPRHWLQWYLGEARFNFEVPPAYVPTQTTADQIREVNAMVHAENELIDDAVGRVMDYLQMRGWSEETDIFFTTDHGELQGDFGMLFKGPYHIEALMHVPFIWRPAPAAGIAPAIMDQAAGHMDLAPTMVTIAGADVPEWMQGQALPTQTDAAHRDHTTTEWIDSWEGNDVVLETLAQDGWVITAYGETNFYTGEEGELYRLSDDPKQWNNLWDDLDHASVKSDLLAELKDRLPAGRPNALDKVAPV